MSSSTSAIPGVSSTAATAALAFGAGAAVAAGVSYLLGGRKSSSSSSPSKTRSAGTGDVSSSAEFNDAKAAKKAVTDTILAAIESFVGRTAKKMDLPDAAIERVRRLMKYTCIGGKMNRGVGVLLATRALCSWRGEPLTEELAAEARTAGAAIEVMQGAYLLLDDIMDGAEVRRNEPAWWCLPEVALDAVNDGLILESLMFDMLEQQFGGSDKYLPMLKLYLRIGLRTQLGQMLDLTSNPQAESRRLAAKEQLAKYDHKTWERICLHKTAGYTYTIVFSSAAIICGATGDRELDVIDRLSDELGLLFQMQDDRVDLYPVEVTGKVGTDLQTAKCSAMLVKALEMAAPDQRAVIEANIGRADADKEARVVAVYKELGVFDAVDAELERRYTEVERLANDAGDVLPPALFIEQLELIRGRQM